MSFPSLIALTVICIETVASPNTYKYRERLDPHYCRCMHYCLFLQRGRGRVQASSRTRLRRLAVPLGPGHSRQTTGWTVEEEMQWFVRRADNVPNTRRFHLSYRRKRLLQGWSTWWWSARSQSASGRCSRGEATPGTRSTGKVILLTNFAFENVSHLLENPKASHTQFKRRTAVTQLGARWKRHEMRINRTAVAVMEPA